MINSRVSFLVKQLLFSSCLTIGNSFGATELSASNIDIYVEDSNSQVRISSVTTIKSKSPILLEKSLEQIKTEVLSSSINQKHRETYTSIFDQIARINQQYNPELHQEKRLVPSKLTETEIRNWCEEFKKLPSQEKKAQLNSLFAVIMQAVKITYEYLPRPTQLISALCLTQANSTKGRILQIKTGEGKTLTTAIAAAVKCLLGESVDIISSSEVLSRRDSSDQNKLYNILSLSSADITAGNLEEVRNAYKQPIVYGTLEAFIGHYLKEQFYGEKHRGARVFDTLIIDEADNLLVDGIDKLTLLSSQIPGMEALFPLLAYIYKTIEWLVAGGAPPDKIRDHIIDEARLIIAGQRPGIDSFIPSHLQNFAQYQLSIWVESAFQAIYSFHENVTHVTHGNGSIRVVDYSNTGVISTNQVLSNAVHQFIQLKDQHFLTSETLLGPYISYRGYLALYESNKIYGMTGTLGDPATQDFISSVYGLECFDIPTYKLKQFILYPEKLLSSEEDWISSVTNELNDFVLQQQRCALVLCETLEALETLKKGIITHCAELSESIHTYSRNDLEKAKEATLYNELTSGQILISTNLAGRGTDIKISKPAQSNGGLHVIVTFLPLNERVEEQNLGRTARQGQKGSARIIMRASNQGFSLLPSQQIITRIRQEKSKEQVQRYKHFHVYSLPKQELHDKYFRHIQSHFSDLRKKGTFQTSFQRVKFNQICDWWAFQYHLIQTYQHYQYALQQRELSETLKIKNPTITLPVNTPFQGEPDYIYETVAQDPRLSLTALQIKDKVFQYLFETETSSDIERFKKIINSYLAPSTQLFQVISKILGIKLSIITQSGDEELIGETGRTIYLGKLTGGEFATDVLIPSVFNVWSPNAEVSQHRDNTQHKTKGGTHLLPALYVYLEDSCIEIEIKDAPCANKAEQPSDQVYLSKDIYEAYFEALKQFYQRHFAQEKKLVMSVLDDFVAVCKQFYQDSTPNNEFYISGVHLIQLAGSDTYWEYYFEKALSLDPGIRAFLYYDAARRRLASNDRAKAVDYLTAAEENLEEFLYPWLLTSAIIKSGNASETQEGITSGLTKQIIGRISFVEKLKENIHKNRGIIQNAPLTHSIALMDSTQWISNFQSLGVLEEDVTSLKNSGISSLFRVETKAPSLSIFDMIGLTILGTIQAIGGIALMATGVGITVGSTLFSEGLHDVINAIKNGITGQAVDWGSYWINKGFSAFLHTLGAVWSSIKAGGNWCSQTFKAKLIGYSAGELSSSELHSLTVKTISTTIQQTLVHTSASYALDILKRNVLQYFQNSLEHHALNAVRDLYFKNIEFSKAFNLVCGLDKLNVTNSKMSLEIKKAMSHWATRDIGAVLEKIKQITETIHRSDSSTLTNVLNTSVDLGLYGYDLSTLLDFMTNYCKELAHKFIEEAKKVPSINDILRKKLKDDLKRDDDINKIVEALKTVGVITEDYCTPGNCANPNLDGDKANFKRLHNLLSKHEFHNLGDIYNKIINIFKSLTDIPDINEWASHILESINGRINEGIGKHTVALGTSVIATAYNNIMASVQKAVEESEHADEVDTKKEEKEDDKSSALGVEDVEETGFPEETATTKSKPLTQENTSPQKDVRKSSLIMQEDQEPTKIVSTDKKAQEEEDQLYQIDAALDEREWDNEYVCEVSSLAEPIKTRLDFLEKFQYESSDLQKSLKQTSNLPKHATAAGIKFILLLGAGADSPEEVKYIWKTMSIVDTIIDKTWNAFVSLDSALLDLTKYALKTGTFYLISDDKVRRVVDKNIDTLADVVSNLPKWGIKIGMVLLAGGETPEECTQIWQLCDSSVEAVFDVKNVLSVPKKIQKQLRVLERFV